MAELTVVAKIVAKKEAGAQLEPHLLSMLQPTRKEDGCIAYKLHRDNDDPSVYIFYETWESEEALKQHMATEHFKAFVDATGEITESLEIRKLTKMG